MTLDDAYQELVSHLKRVHSLGSIGELLGWDEQVNLPPVEPAKINFYSSVNDLMPDLTADCEVEDQFHLGAYDYLTRVMYPLVVGAENARHNSVFSERCQELARAFNPDCFAELSRVRGLVMRKR